MRQNIRLGDVLIKEGLVTAEQLQEALNLQNKEKLPLGQILINYGYVDEEGIAKALSKQLGLPFVSLKDDAFFVDEEKKSLQKILPYGLAAKYRVFPISFSENALTLAVPDPSDMNTLDNIERLTGYKVVPVIAVLKDILNAIDRFYKEKDKISAAIDNIGIEEMIVTETEQERTHSINELMAQAEDAPVVHLVDLLIHQAVKQNASDIHIEPQRNKLCVRYRIDGELYEVPPPPKQLHLAIVSRIKILSKLDIAEKRLPQDGAFTVKLGERYIDIRVSCLPTIHGEKIVLRILDKESVSLDLSKLGFEQDQLIAFRKAINSPYGLVFLTGPTGSGKTTTLYAALNEINSIHSNIMTVEDPVEYQLEGINQVNVKAHIGLTFAAALRSFLRQDPDIIMVGEVRDLETAEICIRAALTGHLVLSTLHTNDAPSAITRLLDMGVEPYLLMPSLLIVVAQRLVRRLCSCKMPVDIKEMEIKDLLNKYGVEIAYKPVGCEQCSFIGYKGRVAVDEVLTIDHNIRQLIQKGASDKDIKDYATKSMGMLTIFDSAMLKVKRGITSIEEGISLLAG